MLVGTGAILPGVSGGVLCMAFGFYEPMVALFAHPFRTLRRHYQLFIPILLGCGTGFLLLARAVELMLKLAPVATTALFTGLICGTIPGLMKKSGSKVSRNGDPGWAGFVISLMLSFLLFCLLESSLPGSLEPTWGWYVFCGAIWATSMLLPGLSSSSVLLFLGLYEPMAKGLGHLDFSVILPMLAGFLATLLLCAKGVDHLMKHHYAQMLRGAAGLRHLLHPDDPARLLHRPGPGRRRPGLPGCRPSRWPIGWRASRRRTKKPADAERTAPPLPEVGAAAFYPPAVLRRPTHPTSARPRCSPKASA